MYLFDIIGNILGVIFYIWFFSITLRATINSRGAKKAFLLFFCAYMLAVMATTKDPYLLSCMFVSVLITLRERLYWLFAPIYALFDLVRPNKYQKAYQEASESADYWKSEYQKEAHNSRQYKDAYEGEKHSRWEQEKRYQREKQSQSRQQSSSYQPPKEDKMTFEKALALFKLSRGYTKRDVDKAFRKFATAYHADKVANLAPEFQKLAHEKMVQAGEARDLLLARL